MRRETLVAAAVAIVVLACVTGVVLYINRGSHMELTGTIKKIRTQEMDEKSSVIVIDFHVTNPADYRYVVKQVDVVMDVDGAHKEGTVVAELDARRLFDYYKDLGQKFNDTFKVRDQLQPKESGDRMIAAQFDLPVAKLAERKGLKVRITEATGEITELVEQR